MARAPDQDISYGEDGYAALRRRAREYAVKVPPVTEPGSVPEWFEKARIYGHWLWAAEYDDQMYTQQEIEDQAQQLAEAGYTVVFPGAPLGGKGILGIDDPDIINQMKLVVEACHKRDMKVAFRYVSLNIKHLTEDYENHTQISAKNGPVEVVRYRGRVTTASADQDPHARVHYFWALCPNDPEIREAHTTKLAHFFEETGMDGFTPEAWWRAGDACVCPVCRRRFKQDTGIGLPDTYDETFYGNWDNPDYRTWWRWRKESMGEFLREVQRALVRVNSEAMVTVYTNPPAPLRGKWVGPSLEECYGLGAVGLESAQARSHYYSWPYILTRLKYVGSVARAQRMGYWWVPKPVNSAEDFFVWSISRGAGARLWNFHPTGRSKRTYWSWEERNWETFRNPVPYKDTAIYFSALTRTFYGSRPPHSHYREMQGWGQALLRANIPYDVIIDRFEGDLSRYRIIILPNVAVIPDHLRNKLEDYIANGGTLVATYDTGSWSNGDGLLSGFSRDKSEKTSELKDGTIEITHKSLIELPGFSKVPYEGWVRTEMDTRFTNAEVLATFQGSPCVWKESYGEGTIIYLSFRAGQSAYNTGVLKGRQYSSSPETTPNLRHMRQFLAELVNGAVTRSRMQCNGLPEGVIVLPVAHADGGREWINVHLINAVNFAPEKEMKLESDYKIPQTPVTFGNAVINLKLPDGRSVRDVKVLSPDTEAPGDIDWSVSGDQVIFHPEFLHRYSIFSIQLK